MNPDVAGDGAELEGSEISDCDVLDDGEDSEPAEESEEFDGPQR